MENKSIIIILIIGLFLISGCTKQGVITEGKGILEMQITDAPADFNIESAVVTISNVQVHKADYNQEDNESDSGWFTVFEESKTFDLIQIKDIKEFLGSTDLDSGKYTQIRLHVDSATVKVDGEDYELKIPSEDVKLTKSFNIEADKTTTLTLDFDANDSIHRTGSDNYIMRPTIKVIQE